jgi:hypothetical protein
MKRTAIYGSSIVLAHLLVTIVHGSAHSRLHIELSAAERLFVIVVIIVSPLVAGVVLWTSRQRTGLWLLTFSMAASLLFGLYKHFVARGQDRVGEQLPGEWATVFATTAYLLLLSEALGTYIGVHFLFQRDR